MNVLKKRRKIHDFQRLHVLAEIWLLHPHHVDIPMRRRGTRPRDVRKQKVVNLERREIAAEEVEAWMDKKEHDTVAVDLRYGEEIEHPKRDASTLRACGHALEPIERSQ